MSASRAQRRASSSSVPPAAAATCLAACLFAAPAAAAILDVPGSYATIQAALDAAGPGDTVEVSTGVYNERVTFTAGGTAGNPVVLRAAAGHTPVIDGTGIGVGGLTGLVYIEDKAHVQVIGFEIRNYAASGGGDFPAGIWVRGQSNNVEIRDNVVHHIENNGCGNCGAHGIAVYGTSGAGSAHDILIDGNTIRDCTLGWSEAMVLNGNVEDFVVSNNVVHDNNNIGIDMIGFEGECVGCPDNLDRARDGVVTGNLVYNIDSLGNPAYGNDRGADGIYVDGGTRIVIERNIVHDVNIGIELASEHNGKDTSEITVRNNFVYGCHVAGFAIGGYDTNRGSTEDCVVVNNTFYANDTDETGSGEILWQYDTRNNVVENNVFYAGAQNVFITNYYTANTGNTVDYNVYFSAGGAGSSGWAWKDDYHSSFAAWQAATGNDANSQFADPLLAAPGVGDLHLSSGSPAVDAGLTLAASIIGSQDIDGDARVNGVAVDVGADELTICGDGTVDATEECDDGNAVEGDGCDSNCTFTACGNGIVTAGEACDDGNTADGDCCGPSCAFEATGSACSDGEACSVADQCDGAGMCVTSMVPDPSCAVPLSEGRAALKIKGGGGGGSLSWKWGRGPEIAKADFGDPTAAGTQTLCVYVQDGGPPSLLLSISAPAGASWRDLGSKGYKYKDSSLAPDGVKTVQLRPGAAKKGRIKLKAKGPNMALPGLGFGASATLTAQLRNATGLCHGSEFSAPFKANDAGRFQDKSD